MSGYRDLTPHELEVVRAFAAEYGREWKEYLMAAWLSYSFKGRHMGGLDTGTLRCLRNELGHGWLDEFKLPKVGGAA
ncbi:hypothetical protein [Rhizobium sp. RAF56]|uniref:hypothetical protein n=1 Tax=Rhizobium sp. RAF56 TaxID=3233062 RepID=UPI003F9DE7FC